MDKIFQIIKLDSEKADTIDYPSNAPHNHSFEELLIVESGAIDHFIDFNHKVYKAPLVCYIAKGKMHKAIPKTINGKYKIWAIRFRSEFIAETIFQQYSYFHNNSNITYDKGSGFQKLITICELIDYEFHQKIASYSIIKQLLSTLFTMIEAENRKQNVNMSNLSLQYATFKSFLTLLEANFYKFLGVDFYAKQVSMTSRKLNSICQNILGQSVSEIIETRKLIEAKNLLINTNKTISEIGFEVGYNEKSYFTSVFKKKSGQTPKEFREEMRKLLIS